MSLREARDAVLKTLVDGAGDQDCVDLADALGRVLGVEIRATDAFPAADNSAMDGFALRAADLQDNEKLKLQGESLAGKPHEAELAAGHTIAVMTGGLLPVGADSVVPVEQTSGFAAREDGTIAFSAKAAVGDNIRPRASIREVGDLLLAAGKRISPAMIGVLASQGLSEVSVGRRPRVAVLPGGDEIVDIGASPRPGQVRNSNAYALVAQLAAAGALPTLLPVLRDHEADVTEKLGDALDRFDLVCSIGGVSMGSKDFIRPVFAKLGGKTQVESIRIKPGKPTLFGTLEKDGHKSALLGLPGNPASSFSIFALLGRAWVLAFQGLSPEAVTSQERGSLWYSKVRANRRLQALPGRILLGPDGVVVRHIEQLTSADLFCLAEADALFLVPENDELRDGDLVDWVPLPR